MPTQAELTELRDLVARAYDYWISENTVHALDGQHAEEHWDKMRKGLERIKVLDGCPSEINLAIWIIEHRRVRSWSMVQRCLYGACEALGVFDQPKTPSQPETPQAPAATV